MATIQKVVPPEWAPQDSVMLTWPHEATDWKPYLSEITETFLQLSEIIASHEHLIIATPKPDNVRSLLANRLDNQAMSNVSIYLCQSNDTWARDHGPISLSNGELLDFKFNGWGEKFDWKKDNEITHTLFCQDAFKGKLVDYTDFVLEGGSIESNGKGTIMTTSFCLLAKNRNQPLTKEQIEVELKRRLCADNVIWIDHGHLIGDDTDGHIDTIVRFAPDDTLIYVGCDDKDDEQYSDFMLLELQLKSLRNKDGKPFHLIRLPMPYPVYDGFERLPATYANYLVINGAVIVPTYHQEELDDKAMSLIGSAFPNREVIGVDASTIIRQHGSIHCLTMQLNTAY